jgi:hypothetical protein
MFPDLMKGLLGGPFSEQQFGRIPGRDAKHKKDNDGYSQKGGNQYQYSSKNVNQHRISKAVKCGMYDLNRKTYTPYSDNLYLFT